jgi:GTPase Era involved in 16S rRNA processing
MCKEIPVIPVDRVVDKKIIIGKSGEGQKTNPLALF